MGLSYTSLKNAFMLKLRRDRIEHFCNLDVVRHRKNIPMVFKGFCMRGKEVGETSSVHQCHSQNAFGNIAGGDSKLGCLCGKAETGHVCDGSTHSSGCIVYSLMNEGVYVVYVVCDYMCNTPLNTM